MPPTRNRAWVWIFVLLAVASVGVAIFMIQYNLAMQLTPEQLTAARERWRELGPRNYDMVYTKQIDGGKVEKFAVKVRSGRAIEVLMDGMPLEPRLLSHHSMEGLYADIGTLMKRDAEPGKPRTYDRAYFEEKTGALQSYVHRVMGTQHRVALEVTQLRKVDTKQ